MRDIHGILQNVHICQHRKYSHRKYTVSNRSWIKLKLIKKIIICLHPPILGSIVEPQGLHQDDLNSLCYNSSKTRIIIANIMTFCNCKRKKMKIAQVGVGSNIAQNHSSRLQEVTSGHCWPKFTWNVDQKWNYVKLESIRKLLRITRLTHRKSGRAP